MKRVLDPETRRDAASVDESHWLCCVDDNLALCGTDVTEDAWADFDAASCVVCEDLRGSLACPRGSACKKGCASS